MRLLKYFLFVLIINGCNTPKDKSVIPSNGIVHSTIAVEKDYSISLKAIGTLKKVNRPGWNQLSRPAKEKLFTEAVCNTIIPNWYGTPWSFNGMSEIPRNGSIACGYFVTTVLRDAGVSLQRIKLAQSASQVIIQSLTPTANINRFSNVPIEKFVAYIRQKGYGLYIAGLDCHVGFIYNDGKDVYFIHANYAGKREVIKEKALESYVLKSSKYRIAGKISANETLLNKWITAQ